MSFKTIFASFLCLSLILAACARTTPPAPTAPPTLVPAALATLPPTEPPLPTPNTQAMVDAAVVATDSARSGAQATLEAAVAATLTAMPPIPTPTPAVEYVTLSEEELAALIDTSVDEAVNQTSTTSQAAASIVVDGVVTADEIAYVYSYYDEAVAALLYADQLIQAYDDLYGELADETLETLQTLEGDLASMEDDLAAINQTLQEISLSLQQGLALSQEALAELEAAADKINATLTDLQTQADTWATTLKAELDNRATKALEVTANQVPTDRVAAIQSALDYITAVRQAFADQKISRDELANIAQLGANAAAGLSAHGGLQLQGLSGKINEITTQLARGQFPTAKLNLEGFAGSLPSRP